jgi:hypothetical protein
MNEQYLKVELLHHYASRLQQKHALFGILKSDPKEREKSRIDFYQQILYRFNSAISGD